MFENVSGKQLTRAAQLKEHIEELQSELEALLGAGSSTKGSPAVGSSGGRSRGSISAAGLARIKAAQKARWAKFRKEKGAEKNGTTIGGHSPSGPDKSERTMSAAAKARIGSAARKRWAKAKDAGRNAL